jgi:mono/diheme cytochrome c family protein
MTWSRDGNWTFPTGSIWVKHFDIETTRGNPTTKKRLETRLIVKNATGAYGVSYRWNDAGTEATLVPDEGVSFPLTVVENGVSRTQTWQIPSRSQCLACHTPQAGHALSFNTRQLNLDNTLNGFSGNQLELLRDAGYLNAATPPPSAQTLSRHLRPDETAYPVEARARSYLAVNCSYCHMAGGTAAPAAWDGRAQLTFDQTGLLNGAASNNGGSNTNKLVVPGDTTHSIVLNRIAVTNGFTRMPPLASSELDQTNISLLTNWIASLGTRQSFDDWRATAFGSPSSPEGAPGADPDGDGVTNEAEYLLGTQPLSGTGVLVPQVTHNGATQTVTLTLPANRSAVIETSTDLSAWTTWDAPGNAGLPHGGGTVSVTGPTLGTKQFFRVLVTGN